LPLQNVQPLLRGEDLGSGNAPAAHENVARNGKELIGPFVDEALQGAVALRQPRALEHEIVDLRERRVVDLNLAPAETFQPLNRVGEQRRPHIG